MKITNLTTKFIALLVVSLAGKIDCAASCNVSIAVVPSDQYENIPDGAAEYLTTRLQQLATVADNVAADTGISPFVLTGKFNHVYESTMPGPPIQTVLNTTLTLYVVDTASKTIYASTAIDLKGVGTSPQRALINAMSAVNVKNNQIATFLDKAKRKIIDYYDSSYPSIISRARRAAQTRNYDEALWLLSMIPECCKGYDESSKLTLDIYQSYIDNTGSGLLMAAQGAWASAQNSDGARAAFGYLTQIDPGSKAYAQAQTLADEIKKSIKDDREFNLRQKHKDNIDLQKLRIESARAVGVAYGQGQQPVSTNINWIR